MKFVLGILLCSQLTGTCMPPYQWPEKFDDSYDCMVQGYVAALEKIEEMGREDVNNNKIYIKFGCYPEQQLEGEPAKFDTLVKLWY